MSANDGMPSLWSRRRLLATLAAGSVMAVSGCRVQLEEGAPRIPLVPTRVPMKDERTLLAVLDSTRSLGSLAKSVPGGPAAIAGRLSAVHEAQVAVLERLLTEGGVPETLFGSLPAGVLSRPVLSPPVLPLAVLSAAETASVSDLALAGLTSANLALMGSLVAQRLAAVTLLGGTVAEVGSPGLNAAQAVALLAAARSSVYGFEIVATHTDASGQLLAMTALSSLRSRVSELEKLAGPVPPPPLGYVLPFPVTDPGSARRLALHVLDALLSDLGAALEPAAGDADSLATLTHWLGETESMASRWGAPLAAFPGLADG